MSRYSESPEPVNDFYAEPPRGRRGGGHGPGSAYAREAFRVGQPRSRSRSRSLADDGGSFEAPPEAPPRRRRRHRQPEPLDELPPEPIPDRHTRRHRGEVSRGDRPRHSRRGDDQPAEVDPRESGRNHDRGRDRDRDMRKMAESQQAHMRSMMGMNPVAMQMAMMQQMQQMGMHPGYMQAMQQQQQMMMGKGKKAPADGSSSDSGDSSSSSDSNEVMNPAAMAAMAAMSQWAGSGSAMSTPGMPPPQGYRPPPQIPGMPPPPPPPPPPPGAPGAEEADVEAWLAKNEINEEGADRLRALPPHLQAKVMRAPVIAGGNASDTLLARIRDAEMNKAEGPGNSKKPSSWIECAPMPARQSAKKDIETMINDYRLSVACAWTMRALPPEKQRLAAKIDPSGQADPSGYVAEQLKSIV